MVQITAPHRSAIQHQEVVKRPMSAPAPPGRVQRASIKASDPQPDGKPFLPSPVRRLTSTLTMSDYGKVPKEFDNGDKDQKMMRDNARFMQLCTKKDHTFHPGQRPGRRPHQVSHGESTPARPASAPSEVATPKGQKQRPLEGVGLGRPWSAGSCFRKLYRTKEFWTKGMAASGETRDKVILVQQDLGGTTLDLVDEPVEIQDDWYKTPYNRLSQDDRRSSTSTMEAPVAERRLSAGDRRRSSFFSQEKGSSGPTTSRRRSSTLSFKSSEDAAAGLRLVDRKRSSTVSFKASEEDASSLPADSQEMSSKPESTDDSPKAKESTSPTAVDCVPSSDTRGQRTSLLDDHKDLIKNMKHFRVTVPTDEWVQRLSRLMSDTVVHPHALVYLGENLAQSKTFMQTFMDEIYEQQLIVSEYSFDSPDSTVTEALRSQAIENSVGSNARFLVTNPKFTNQLGEPIVTCIIHMDTKIEDPVEYGIRLSPVPPKHCWDAISVLFLEPDDTSIALDIEEELHIQFKEIPFDVPEISHSPKKSWQRRSIQGSNWYKST